MSLIGALFVLGLMAAVVDVAWSYMSEKNREKAKVVGSYVVKGYLYIRQRVIEFSQPLIARINFNKSKKVEDQENKSN